MNRVDETYIKVHGEVKGSACRFRPAAVFWDGSKEMMFRFVNTNAEGFSRKAALQELETLHKKEFQASLIPGPLCIDVGSVVAAESIREYFRSAGAHVPVAIDERATREWLKSHHGKPARGLPAFSSLGTLVIASLPAVAQCSLRSPEGLCYQLCCSVSAGSSKRMCMEQTGLEQPQKPGT